MQASEEAPHVGVPGRTSYSAYATPRNVKLGGSRFVRRVEIRTDGERIWLRGRRTRAWLLCLRPLGWIWGIVWWLVALVAAAVLDTPELVPSSSKTDRLGDLWTSEAKGLQTVSWRAADTQPVARSRAGKTRKGDTVPGESVVEIRVPIGRKGRMSRLTLTTPTKQRATLVQVLSGRETSPPR